MRIDELHRDAATSRSSPSSSSRRRPTRARRNLYAALQRAARAGARLRLGDLRRRRLDARRRRSRSSRASRDEYGLEAMAHFTCVGATVDELRGDARPDARRRHRQRARAARRPAAGPGASATQTEGGLEYSRELVELDRATTTTSAIGGAVLPRDAHPRDRPPRTTCATSRRRSTRACEFLITQLFFDNADYFDFVDARARRRHRRADRPGHHADHQRRPDQAHHRAVRRDDARRGCEAALEARADDPEAVAELGVAYATLQCAELLARGAPGHPLLHAQPLARDARDPQRAEAAAPVGDPRRRAADPGRLIRRAGQRPPRRGRRLPPGGPRAGRGAAGGDGPGAGAASC